jgi:hypothetical protein
MEESMSRSDKATDMWSWAPKAAQATQDSVGKGIGRKYAPQPVPGYEKIAELIGKSNKQARYRHRRAKKRARWNRTKDMRQFNRRKREILNRHPHETTPVTGKKGRWKPVVNAAGNSPVLSRDFGDASREQMPKGDTPVDNRYGRDVDFESAAQMNARVDSYSRS